MYNVQTTNCLFLHEKMQNESGTVSSIIKRDRELQNVAKFVYQYISKYPVRTVLNLSCDLLICPELETVFILSTGSRFYTQDYTVRKFMGARIWKTEHKEYILNTLRRFFSPSWRIVTEFKSRQLKKNVIRRLSLCAVDDGSFNDLCYDMKEEIFYKLYPNIHLLNKFKKAMDPETMQRNVNWLANRMLKVPLVPDKVQIIL